MAKLGNVYLLDDDPSMGESLTRVMRTVGYEVEDFSNPMKFLEFEDFHSPGVILMDMQMPHLRGVEVQEKLMERGVRLPIIFISGESQPLDIIRAMKNGSADFLLKPFDLDSLLDALDKALALDKENQKKTFMRRAEDKEIQQNKLFEDKLRQAIQDGLIVPHYQPEVDLRTGEIIGFESLARWSDQEMGAISPAQFIPFAEKHWLIEALTESMVKRVMHDSVQIHEKFPNAKISINISPDLLKGKYLFKLFADYMDQFGGDFSLFDLEIVESQVMSENLSAQVVLQSLIGQGFSTSIDDFGKQHSSLSRLANLPFKRLKIDRAFIANLEPKSIQESIVRSIVSMANELNMAVTAEAIETEFQREKLIELGCHRGQGWLFAKSMPLDQLLQLPLSLH